MNEYMDKQQVLERFNACIGAGDVAGAHAVVEAAYPALSRDLDVAFLFARARFEQGRFKEAAKVLRPLTVALPHEPVVRHMYLDALINGGDHKAAVEAGKRFQKSGRTPELDMTIARAYGMWNKPAPALALVDRVLAEIRDSADAHAMRGILLNQTGRTLEGIDALGRAVALAPGNARHLFDLASLHLQLGDQDGAEPLLRRVLERDPSHPGALRTLGELLFKTKRAEEALPVLTAALARNRDDTVLWSMYLTAETMHGDADRAAAVAADLLRADPDNPLLIRDMAFICCRAGEVEHVRELSAKLARHPETAITGLALESTALNKAGRFDEALDILQIDTLVTTKVIDPPAGWNDLDSFNADLTAQILSHPDLGEHATNGSLINEACTFELFDGSETGAIRGLRDVVEAETQAYAENTEALSAAPAAYLACQPDTYDLECWANVMSNAGNHTAHFHPRAWLSGVYYPCLPETMADDPGDIAGALEVGCGFADFLPNPDEPTRAIKPREGTMTMFPSYVGHRTVPVETDGKPRISVAFNVAISGKG